MTPQDDPALWELLGKAPSRPVSPFFARDVIRAVRARESLWEHVQNVFRVRKVVVLASAAAIVVTVAAVSFRPMAKSVAVTASNAQVEEADDEMMLDLDDLVAADDTNTLADISAL